MFWGAPTNRNGVITGYQLRLLDYVSGTWRDIFSGMGLSASVDSLLPYSKYGLRLAVSTKGGPGFSQLVNFTTRQSGKLIIHHLRQCADMYSAGIARGAAGFFHHWRLGSCVLAGRLHT